MRNLSKYSLEADQFDYLVKIILISFNMWLWNVAVREQMAKQTPFALVGI